MLTYPLTKKKKKKKKKKTQKNHHLFEMRNVKRPQNFFFFKFLFINDLVGSELGFGFFFSLNECGFLIIWEQKFRKKNKTKFLGP
jgi:hypothetical protein